jgi:hypothetical protein
MGVVTLNDLNKIGKVTGLYELKPGVQYLVLVDGKKFSYEEAHALMHHIEDAGIDLVIHVVGTLNPERIEIHEIDTPRKD